MKYFIYFSATGNGDLLADILKEKGYTPIKVETIKPLGKMNFFRILKYGGHAMMNKKANIKPLNIDIKEDDTVIIGSPIWNDRLSTPINAVLDQFEFDKKKTTFILYPAGKTTNKSKSQIAKLGFEGQIIVTPYPKKYIDKTKSALNVL